MKSQKTSYPPINMGTSFLLVIFIILCMVIFAVLSLSGALKDYEYSKYNAARTSAYYDACNEAEEIRAKIEAQESSETIIEYSVPVNENEVLHVILERPGSTISSYKIKLWKLESIARWESRQTLPVLGND